MNSKRLQSQNQNIYSHIISIYSTKTEHLSKFHKYTFNLNRIPPSFQQSLPKNNVSTQVNTQIINTRNKTLPHTFSICILFPNATAIQSGCATDHCNWLISAPAVYIDIGSIPFGPATVGNSQSNACPSSPPEQICL